MLELWTNIASHRHGAAALASCLERQAARSIAELRLSEEDFAALLGWARRQDGRDLARRLQGSSYEALPSPCERELWPAHQVVALPLLALFSELVGRSECDPWIAVRDGLGDCSVRRHLFTNRYQPKEAVREALKQLAESLDLLRPARATQVNYWFRLLQLQSGFGPAHLPHVRAALDGQAAIAVLEDFLVDQRFHRAWGVLRDHVDGHATRDDGVRALREAKLFRDPMAVVAAASAAPTGAAAEPAAFAVDWRLQWAGDGAPEVVLTPRIADAGERTRIVLHVNGEPRLRYRRVDGVLRAFAASYRSPLMERWVVTDHEAFEEIVELFPHGDVRCFDAAGLPCRSDDAERVRYVVAREELQRGGGGRVAWLGAPGIGVVDCGAVDEVRSVDGTVLWERGRRVLAPTGELELRFELVEAESPRVRLRLHHRTSIEILSACSPSMTLAIHREGDGITTLDGDLRPSAVLPLSALRVRARAGGRVVQRTFELRLQTAAALDDDWLDPGTAVEARRVRGGALRVSLGPELEGRDAFVTAGSAETPVDACAKPARAPTVVGFGEPLSLTGCRGWEDGPRRLLAARVEDHGEVVRYDVCEGRVIVEVVAPVEIDQDHWLLIWPRTGAPTAVGLESDSGNSTTLKSLGCGAAADLRAVAVCFRDAVMGASWAPDWSHDLDGTPSEIVGRVRALHLPVLAEPHLPQVQAALGRDVPGAVLALAQRCPTPLLIDADHRLTGGCDDGWPHVARAIALGLRLADRASVDAVEDLVRAEIGEYDPQPVLVPPVPAEQQKLFHEWQAVHGHAAECVLLAVGVRQPVDALKHGGGGRPFARRLLDASCSLAPRALAGVDQAAAGRARRSRLRQRRERLCELPAGVLEAAELWAHDTCQLPGDALRGALLHDRGHRRVQLELLAERAGVSL